MTEPAPIRYDTLVQVFQIEECQSKYHLGREFSDVFETMFIIAWIQLIPTLITLLHYVSGIFSKGRHIICCCEKWKKSKVHADNMTEPDSEPNFRSTVRRGDNVEDYRPDKTDKKGSRKRSNGKMCCIVFLRNAAVFLNYLIVLSAFIASILFIYVYLGEQDLDVINPSENFYILRGSVTIEMILAILGIFYVFLMPVVMYYSPLPERGISVLLFNARLNLQLLIYVVTIFWFVLGFVFTYYGYFYSWSNCGYTAGDLLD